MEMIVNKNAQQAVTIMHVTNSLETVLRGVYQDIYRQIV